MPVRVDPDRVDHRFADPRAAERPGDDDDADQVADRAGSLDRRDGGERRGPGHPALFQEAQVDRDRTEAGGDDPVRRRGRDLDARHRAQLHPQTTGRPHGQAVGNVEQRRAAGAGGEPVPAGGGNPGQPGGGVPAEAHRQHHQQRRDDDAADHGPAPGPRRTDGEGLVEDVTVGIGGIGGTAGRDRRGLVRADPVVGRPRRARALGVSGSVWCGGGPRGGAVTLSVPSRTGISMTTPVGPERWSRS